MNTTYLVLGGNGAMGVQLICYLLHHFPDVKVLAVGRNPEKPPPFTLYRGVDDSRLEYHQIHIAREPERFVRLCDEKQPNTIVNTAAESESSTSWKESWRYFETNCTALTKIVESLVKISWLKKWVQISSSEVYGSVNEPITEMTSLNPSTPYSVSKAAADFYLMAMAHARNFPVNIIRPSSVYGPGQQLHRIIPKAILCALLRRKLSLEGGGAIIKSFLHTDDLSRAICLVAEQGPIGQIYHVGPGEGTAIHYLVEKIFQKTGASFQDFVKISPARAGHDTQSLLNYSRITQELGWNPHVNLDKGLDGMIEWAKQHLSYLKDLPTSLSREQN